MSSPMVVNVGGTRFHTTIETLRNGRGRGDRSIFRDKNISCHEETFVDRDPTVLGYILNYLRDGSVTFPRNEYIITLAKYEAWHYGLHHLAGQLPAGDFHTVEASWDSEAELFRSPSSDSESHDPDSLSPPRFPCDKETFVDRDPTVFGYILNYLRDGSVTFPRDEYIITLTKYEAWYYGLHHLADQLPAGDFHTVETSWDSEDELFRSSSSGLEHSHDLDSMSSPVLPVFSHESNAIFSFSSERNDFNEVTTSVCPENDEDSDGISSSAESNYLCDCDSFSPVSPIYHRGINDESNFF
ncbi:unnamed protein product [Cylicocyclus nassatus]|uniref:Potassium channel tetramerisation-type BTB domain-containing protein n=1 Tax=Cylicocyclus nassatus TaxID=53992 RepID=A0AA36GJZ1_CYLNA|nr:unnamed protein product [Cylicocyclus nassatus]